MSTVTVYKVGKYDITKDRIVMSKRLATKVAAARYDLAVFEDTATEVDESALGADGTPGMTRHPSATAEEWIASGINGPRAR